VKFFEVSVNVHSFEFNELPSSDEVDDEVVDGTLPKWIRSAFERSTAAADEELDNCGVGGGGGCTRLRAA
jgi:hypothetical protein